MSSFCAIILTLAISFMTFIGSRIVPSRVTFWRWIACGRSCDEQCCAKSRKMPVRKNIRIKQGILSRDDRKRAATNKKIMDREMGSTSHWQEDSVS
jgi:hypothetical protein